MLLSVCLSLLAASGSISMMGIKIGDRKEVLKSITLSEVANSGDMVKYETSNGNDFSVTTSNGKIVYMENDWMQDPKASKPLFTDFVFGTTTLADIRVRFGNNGFAYKAGSMSKTSKFLILFNCYQFDSKTGEVLVLITKVPLDIYVTEETVASNAKLDAIIIADMAYLDGIWETEKLFDPDYRKIASDVFGK